VASIANADAWKMSICSSSKIKGCLSTQVVGEVERLMTAIHVRSREVEEAIAAVDPTYGH
jgi:hypothetical protein